MSKVMEQPEQKIAIDKPIVLVVEDSESIRKLLGMNLKRQGYRALMAPNGHVAIQALQKYPEIQAVILDMMMPVMNGPAFIRQARTLGFRDIPIVVLTGMNDFLQEDRLAKLKNAGVNEVLTKPVDLDRLNETLMKLLAG